MLRPKLIKNSSSGLGHLSGTLVVVFLILGLSRPAFADETAAAPDEQPHLQLAPINLRHSVRGNVGYTFQRNTLDGTTTTQQALGLNVKANVGIRSYFWQPWLATITGDLTGDFLGTGTSGNMTPTYKTVTTTTGGDVSLNVLSSSRFPFSAKIYKQDGRTDSFYNGTSQVNQTSGYRLSQAYTSRRITGNATFNSSKSGGPNISTDYADTFNMGFTVQLGRNQSVTVTGDTAKDDQPGRGRSTSRDSLVVNHIYKPNDQFAIASLVNQLNSNYNLVQGGVTTQSMSNWQQFNSFASFRPQATPLTMTSNVRLIKSDTNSNGTDTSAPKSSNFNLGANYLFSPRIRLYGSVNVADNLGVQTTSTNAAVTATKPFITKSTTMIGGFRYSGAVGGSLSSANQTSIDSANQTTAKNALNLGVYLTHALNKDSEIGMGHLTETLQQTISSAATNRGTHGSKLGTGGSVSLTRVEGKETAVLRLGANDSRTLSGPSQVFQMINLQASRGEAMSRNESLQGSMTVQATHSEIAGQQSIPNTLTPSAEVTYRNRRAFKILRLNFESNVRIADTNIAPSQGYNARDQATRSWDNGFDYQIGRLTLRLSSRVAKIGSSISSSVFFMMGRAF